MKIKLINPEIPEAIWTIKDILIVLFSELISMILFTILILILLGDRTSSHIISLYASGILMILYPILWIKLKYGLSKEALGLTRGKLRLSIIILYGVVGAIICFLIMVSLKHNLRVINHKTSYSPLHIILAPFTPGGFVRILLIPIGEEILYRGFIYGCLRKKLGVILGIGLQSFVFTLSHFQYYAHGTFFTAFLITFILGLIFGFLYEKTATLYPPIICHGLVNYLANYLTI